MTFVQLAAAEDRTGRKPVRRQKLGNDLGPCTGGGNSLRKGKPFIYEYSSAEIKCPPLNINCNTRSSLKRNLQRTLTRRGSSEKEMSRNRLEKVDMIKLNRNILFKNLPSGSKLIFDHSQLCTRRAQGE